LQAVINQRGFDGGAAGGVLGEIDGESLIGFGGCGDEVWLLRCCQEAGGDTADEAVSRQGDDGYAQPEGIAGGGVAADGEGIERDIDGVITLEMVMLIGRLGEE